MPVRMPGPHLELWGRSAREGAIHEPAALPHINDGGSR
jgi:hypothetical protein